MLMFKAHYEKIIYVISLYPKFNSILAILICCSGLLLFLPKLTIGFLPELREGHYMIHTSSLTGTSLEETMRIGNKISENVLNDSSNKDVIMSGEKIIESTEKSLFD